ncbi:hypothetical protein SAMN00808754_1633 [Thermanaeromonas toyohensis ToBE]|uniref:Uncharacterized protein n=1 Tax=Thermanaeromonas toyohensis ToBE TaxID=698762 RepID=A0A1W1VTS4_9FIRM|nr:hypothetical protein [Thermanaeromonas toyohensis]SMB96759.1 hypothetical protein SAMN00808754_1633 [Thermanaeromonas toyohensis ToBE]
MESGSTNQWKGPAAWEDLEAEALSRAGRTDLEVWQQFFQIFRARKKKGQKIKLLEKLCENKFPFTAEIRNLADYPVVEDVFMRTGKLFTRRDVEALWDCKYLVPKYWLFVYAKYLHGHVREYATALLREHQELVLLLLLWSLYWDDSGVRLEVGLKNRLDHGSACLCRDSLRNIVLNEWDRVLDVLKTSIKFGDKWDQKNWTTYIHTRAGRIRKCLAEYAGVTLADAAQKPAGSRPLAGPDGRSRENRRACEEGMPAWSNGQERKLDAGSEGKAAQSGKGRDLLRPDVPKMWLELFSRPVRWMELDPAVREQYLKKAEEAAVSQKAAEVKRILEMLASGSFPILVSDSEAYSQMWQFAALLYRRFWRVWLDAHCFNVYSGSRQEDLGSREAGYWDKLFRQAVYRHGPEYVLSAISRNPGKEGIARAGTYHVLRHWFQRTKAGVVGCGTPAEAIGVLQSLSAKVRGVRGVLAAAGFRAEAVLGGVFKDFHNGRLLKLFDALVGDVLEKVRALCPFRDAGWALDRVAAVLADMEEAGLPVGVETAGRIERERGLVRSLLCRLAALAAQAYRLREEQEKCRKKEEAGFRETLIQLLYSNPYTGRSVRRAWGVCLRAWLGREFGLPPEGIVARVASSFLRACGYVAVRVKQQGGMLLTRWWLNGGGSTGFRFVPARDPRWNNPLEEIQALYALAVAADACCRFLPGRSGGGNSTRERSQGSPPGSPARKGGFAASALRPRYPRSAKVQIDEGRSGYRCGNGEQKQRAHQVCGHFRRLLPGQKASEKALENALLYAGLVFLPEGFTFVRPHVRGGIPPGPDVFSATVYAQSVAYLLDLCAAGAAAGRGMDPKVFGFEVRVSRSGRYYESFRRVGDPLKAADGLRCSGHFGAE